MKLDLNYTLQFTQEILAIPSPAGYTEKAMNRIAKELEKLGFKYSYSKNRRGRFYLYKIIISSC